MLYIYNILIFGIVTLFNMNGGFCMQLKIPDYERVFRRDPEYKEYPGMDPKVVEALKKDHVLTLYVPDTARWFVSEKKE
jgi:hypothetical protein